ATAEIYTLSLHDALPISVIVDQDEIPGTGRAVQVALSALPEDFDGDVLVLSGDVPLLQAETLESLVAGHRAAAAAATVLSARIRSEEHTSELQSRENLVC